MGRLIDDIALKASITANEIFETNKTLEDIIDDQPTAYDVETVVKQIEEWLKHQAKLECPTDYNDNLCRDYKYCDECRAAWLLRIVRNGGVK